MRDEHIKRLLDEAPLSSLGEAEREAARAHAEEGGWTLARLWKSAGLLVSSMAATVAALAVLTFVAPQQTVAQEPADGGAYTAEAVILGGAESGDEQMTYGQVLTTLYGSDE